MRTSSASLSRAIARWPTLRQGPAADGDPRRAPIPSRPCEPRRRAAPDPRSGGRTAESPFKLHILTRKTLGGLATDLEARVLGADGEPLAGLWAAGETAGFGGGGMHGYSALEGTFLGGCLFSGRQAGRSMAARL